MISIKRSIYGIYGLKFPAGTNKLGASGWSAGPHGRGLSPRGSSPRGSSPCKSRQIFRKWNNFCRCFTQVFVLSTKQDSAHNFLSSTLGSRFGSGSWPLSLVSDTEPIVGSGLKSTRDRLRDQTDSKSISKRSLRHKGMDNISNLKPVVGPYPS